jgi:hypothetical protein
LTSSSDVGVRGNARLTSITGVVLLVLLAVEGVTLLKMGSLLAPHIVIGFLLIGPIGLKVSSTGYKILRYYTHADAYVAEGPPPLLRRLLAPLVIVTTAGLFVSGVVLVTVGPDHEGRWLLVHKVFFVLWFAAMTLHVLLHLTRALRGTVKEYAERGSLAIAGRTSRQLSILAALASGLAFAGWSLHYLPVW